MAERFVGFQRRDGELGRGGDREGFRLVTTASGSCLGVTGHDTSRVGRAIAAAEGEEEGFALCSHDLIPSKTALF